MKKMTPRQLSRGAMVASLYALLSLVSSLLGLGFGPVQLRLSESLCLLPLVLPESVWGLTAGCFVANLMSPYGLPDMVAGTAATAIAATLTARQKNTVFAAAMPVAVNALAVGFVLAVQQTGFSGAFFGAFLFNGGSVAAGEALAVGLLGVPLLRFYRIWSKRH